MYHVPRTSPFITKTPALFPEPKVKKKKYPSATKSRHSNIITSRHSVPQKPRFAEPAKTKKSSKSTTSSTSSKHRTRSTRNNTVSTKTSATKTSATKYTGSTRAPSTKYTATSSHGPTYHLPPPVSSIKAPIELMRSTSPCSVSSMDTRRATEEYLQQLDKRVKGEVVTTRNKKSLQKLMSLENITEEQRDDNTAIATLDADERRETYFRTLAEPDVLIVVGRGGDEREYREYSQMLRSWSAYFDYELRIQQPIAARLNAIRMGTDSEKLDKNTVTEVRFEFPDRKPKEWEWIVSLMAPMATEKINKSNLLVALNWFDKLISQPGLHECDRVFSIEVAAIMAPKEDKETHKCDGTIVSALTAHTIKTRATEGAAAAAARVSKETTKKLSFVIHALELCIRYGLDNSKSICNDIINIFLEKQPTSFQEDMIKRVCFFLQEDGDCRIELWEALMNFVPKAYSDDQRELLVANKLLHEVVYLKISEQKERLAKWNRRDSEWDPKKPTLRTVKEEDDLITYMEKMFLSSQVAKSFNLYGCLTGINE